MRLIDVDALIEELQEELNAHPYDRGTTEYMFIERMIEELDTYVTGRAVEVVHGRWNKKFLYARNWDEYYEYRCPFCGIVEDREHNYCPNCGANMMVKKNG